MTEQELDELAKKLTSDINAEIRRACDGEHYLRWRTIADDIASERLDGIWEWIFLETMSRPPELVMTRYLR